MQENANERLIAKAAEVFEDSKQAELWLKSLNPLLRGQTPLEALDTLEGAARVKRQLNWFAGRRLRRG